MTSRAFSFTRNRVRNLSLPNSGRVTYKDQNTKGLELRVSYTGSKTFFYLGMLNEKSKRIKIGSFIDGVTVKHAQNEAGRLKALLKQGIDPNKSQKAAKCAEVTLRQCLEDYLRVHSKLSVNTKKQYQAEMNRHLGKWLDKPLRNIGRTDVAAKHRELTKKSPSVANRSMRVLRALFNFAHQEYEDEKGKGLFPDNPVSRLSHQRLWNKIERRTGVIKPHQLKAWLDSTERLPEFTKFGEIQRDYLQLVLFTGLRRTEALTLKWKNIDFKGRTLLVEKTKNGKPHMLPLSDYVYKILAKRYKSRINEYVFPSCYGKVHFIEPKKGILKVRELSGVSFTLHDLRRTFITIAESLDISSYAVKRLVNHSMANDVTAGYIVWDIERIREPMQRITDYICKTAGLKESAIIIDLHSRKTI